jgi:hypothetical protein
MAERRLAHDVMSTVDVSSFRTRAQGKMVSSKNKIVSSRNGTKMNASQPRNSARREHEARSLDLVQRVVLSALVAVVFGTFAAVLAAYLALAGDRDLPPTSVTGLWIMTGVMGLGAAAAILLINRRRPYSPWVLLGLLPMAISAPWVLG